MASEKLCPIHQHTCYKENCGMWFDDPHVPCCAVLDIARTLNATLDLQIIQSARNEQAGNEKSHEMPEVSNRKG